MQPPQVPLKILAIGEAWGKNEEDYKHPLVGGSGVEFARDLAKVGLAPAITVRDPTPNQMISHWRRVKSECGIELTNVFNLRPPGNRVEEFFGPASFRDDSFMPPLKKGKYLLPQYRKDITDLWELVVSKKPNLCLCMGNTPTWALTKSTPIISKQRGYHADSFLGVKILPTWHPAYILREYSDRFDLLSDLTKAKRFCEDPQFIRHPRWFIQNPTLSEILEWLHRPAEVYSVDIESGHALYTNAERKRMTKKMIFLINSQISRVGFARSETDAICIPFVTRSSPNLNYWQSTHDEVRAWKLVQFGLSKPIRKIFQNGMYDINRLLWHGMRPHLKDIRDTMLHWHSLFPERPKNLGYLASILTDFEGWKTIYGSGESLKRDE